MRNMFKLSALGLLVSLSLVFGQDVRKNALIELGMSELVKIKEIPEQIKGPIICLGILPDKGEAQFFDGGQKIGAFYDDYFILSESTFAPDAMYFGKDDKMKYCLVIFASNLILFWYDIDKPELKAAGIKQLLQVVNADKDFKSTKFFIR